MTVTQVTDDVAGKIQQITRQKAEKILRANSADFEGQAPTDPTLQSKEVLDDFLKQANVASQLSLKNYDNLSFQTGKPTENNNKKVALLYSNPLLTYAADIT